MITKKNTNNQFLIGSWVSFYPFSVDSYEQQLDQMQEAGLNFNIFPMTFGGGMDTPEVCDQIEREYTARNMLYFMYGDVSEDGRNRAVQYAQGKDHCIGYHLKDEPCGEELPEIGQTIRAYRAADGTRYPFVNLLPSYAGEERLGGTYHEHCSRFVREAGAENIEYLSHDFYPFRMDHTEQGIFSDMEVIRRVALENGRLRTHAFPQASAWNGIRMPNINEMRWNVYAYLAYGFKALSWFNLVCPGSSDTEGEGFCDSVIYRDGTIRDPQLFEDFGNLNREILTLGDTLMKLDTIHAYHTQSNVEGVEMLPSDWMITPVRAENFIISYMTTRQGDQTYVMLFNKAWDKSVTASFALSAFSGIEGLAYISPFDGSSNAVLVEDGVFSDTFRPGEGKLYKLNGKVSYRAVSLDATHTRVDVDLSVPYALTGVDIAGDARESGKPVTVQISTNKRYTEDRTTVHLFDAIPTDGRLRFNETMGKYVRVTFGDKDSKAVLGLAEVRVRFADELAEAEQVTEFEEQNAPMEAVTDTIEVVEVVEALAEVEDMERVDAMEGAEIEEIVQTVEVAETADEMVSDEISTPVTETVTEAVTEAPAVSAEAVLYDVDYSDLDEALAVVDGLVEAEYSEESWKVVKDYYLVATSMKDGTHPQDEVTDAYWQLLDYVRELVPVQWTLPTPEGQTPEEPHEKQSVHVTGGILTVAAATVVGTVAGVITGLFASRSKKKKKK